MKKYLFILESKREAFIHKHKNEFQRGEKIQTVSACVHMKRADIFPPGLGSVHFPSISFRTALFGVWVVNWKYDSKIAV